MEQLPKKVLPFFWHFIKKQPVSFTILFIAPLFIVLETNILPYAVKLVIDGVTENQDNRDNIFSVIAPAIWLGGGAWIIMLVVFRLQHWFSACVMPKFEANIRMAAMDYLTGHSKDYFANQLSGKLSNRVADLARSLSSIRQIICWNIITTFAVVVVSLILLATISPIFSWTLGIWVILQLAVVGYLAKIVYVASEKNAEDKSILSGIVTDAIANIIPVKLFAGRSFELNHLWQKQREEMSSNRRVIINMNYMHLFTDIPITVMLAVMGYFIITGWQSGALTTGDMVFVFNTCWGVTFHIWFLSYALTELFREVGVAKQALAIINRPHEVRDIEGAKPLAIKEGRIEFDDVTFYYNNGENLFKNKNVVIEAGSKVGLVGFSGSGKTSFVNLILRFFDTQDGIITLDGQDIACVTQDSLRSSIAMIPQDASLFHRTLMENIRYGCPDATDEEVIEASKMAYCHEFIETLPEGYNTLVGERGIKLSGGQRQRVSIARAMLKNAPILILDEATSALDSVTEEHIQESLNRLMEGRTVIVIAHRLSTLSQMDRILVFDKGRIIEDGTHEELVKAKGHYAHMWKMQAGGFLPEAEE